MKRTLLLVRHSQALNATPGVSDLERQLSERGKRDAVEAGMRLIKRELYPSGIVTSHSVRTTSTARLIASTIGFPETSILQEPRLYNTAEEDYMDVIRQFESTSMVQMLVGHNFTISHVLQRLVGLRTQEMPLCAVAVLKTTVEDWLDVRTGCAELAEFSVPAPPH